MRPNTSRMQHHGDLRSEREHRWGHGLASPKASSAWREWPGGTRRDVEATWETAADDGPEEMDDICIWGITLIILGAGFFSCCLYAMVISKWMPPSESPLLSWIQKDRYYCLLIPLTIPVTVVAVFLHWLSMKFFKHA